MAKSDVTSKTDLFESMPIPQAVRKMAIPAVLSQLVVLLYNMADTFFIGQTNDPLMVAGVSIILPVFNTTVALGTLIGVGGGAFIPKLMSRERQTEAESVNLFCLKAGVLITGLFCLLIFLLADPLLKLLGAGPDIIAYSKLYMLIVVSCGGIPTVLNNITANLLRSIGMSREAGIGIAAGGLLNVALDPLFMFVLLPRGNEVLGVAVATLISNVVACSYSLYTMLRRQKILAVRGGVGLPEKASVAAVFMVGVPAAMNIFLFDLDYMVLNRLMSGYGDKALAAIGIILKVERFPIQAAIGLCQAMIPLIAYSYGAKNFKRMRGVIKHCLKLAVIIAVVSISCYEIFAHQILRIFIREAETVGYGVEFLRVRTVATLFMILSFFVVHVFQGLGDGKRAFVLCVMRWAAFNIPALFILNVLIGRMGLVWAQIAGDVLTASVSFVVLWSQMRSVGK
ncbi:MAG: MATE family efflux transporter [Firmicutes bacterium]|nr:MATE family efflux transporter [Bacillota bacterium]